MPGCVGPTGTSPYLSSMIDYVDCQGRAIGSLGYVALSGPGSLLGTIAIMALTIFVAFIGYRALFGEAPSIRDAVVALVKIGVALLLAGNWPAFHRLAYDVTIYGPTELAGAIERPLGLQSQPAGLFAGLQSVDDDIAELQARGTGQPRLGLPSTATNQGQQRGPAPLIGPAVRWDPVQDARDLASARTIFLTATVASLAAVRLVAGLLLALTPVFALFLLFDTTRGLVEGWLRGLIGTIIGATGISLVLGTELALMTPWLADVLARRRANVGVTDSPAQLYATTASFALVLLAVLIASGWVGRSLRLPTPLRRVSERWLTMASSASSERMERASLVRSTGAGATERSRALTISEAAAAAARRDRERFLPAPAVARAPLSAAPTRPGTSATSEPRASGVDARRSRPRASSAARRRDRN